MKLTIPYQKDLCLSKEPTGMIDRFLWLDNGCTPQSGFHLCYNEKALKIRLFSNEYPRYIKAEEDDGAIWEDHCLEFFFAPFGKAEPYLNFECNPKGYMIIGFGKDRYDRKILTKELKPRLQLKTAVSKDRWEIEYTIPFEMLTPLYGKEFHPRSKTAVALNLYVCGDRAEPPRYGVWNRIDLPEPDFHCPQFFGEGELE